METRLGISAAARGRTTALVRVARLEAPHTDPRTWRRANRAAPAAFARRSSTLTHARARRRRRRRFAVPRASRVSLHGCRRRRPGEEAQGEGDVQRLRQRLGRLGRRLRPRLRPARARAQVPRTLQRGWRGGRPHHQRQVRRAIRAQQAARGDPAPAGEGEARVHPPTRRRGRGQRRRVLQLRERRGRPPRAVRRAVRQGARPHQAQGPRDL